MMNQEDIFKKVGQILNELHDQYEFLAQNPKQLNELELELFLANANFLSDHVQILRKINSNTPLKAIQEHTEGYTEPVIVFAETRLEAETPVQELEIIQEEETPQQEIEEDKEEVEDAQQEIEEVKEEIEEAKEEIEEAQEVLDEAPYKFDFELSETAPTDKFEFEEKPIGNIFDRPLSEEEEQIIAQKQQQSGENELQQHEPKEDKVEEKLVLPLSTEPIVDKVEEKIVEQPVGEPVKEQEPAARPTLNDLLAGKNNLTGSLNEGNNKTVITDLKQAINLNQKLLYIKDLFNGYNLAYAEAIELLNKMPDFKTADNFLQHNYAVKNNWASKQSTVDQFYELLNQRFPIK